MKNQALFSIEDKSKKLKCLLLQFLFGALRVYDGTQGLMVVYHYDIIILPVYEVCRGVYSFRLFVPPSVIPSVRPSMRPSVRPSISVNILRQGFA